MFSILNRALSWAITSFENKFCLKKRSRLIKASDNRFHVKFMQLEIGLFCFQVDYTITFSAMSIALKECYLMMNFEKNSFHNF